MSIGWVIPHQSRYLQTASIFAAAFNVPVLGAYSFGVAANTGVLIFPLQPNSEYLIERVTVSGDIAEGDFSAALDLTAGALIPVLSLRRSLDNSSIYETALPFPSYVSQQESAVWVHSDRLNDSVVATMTGVLNQTAALVGVPVIRLSVSFSVYCVESTIYNRAFRGSQSLDLAASVRGS